MSYEWKERLRQTWAALPSTSVRMSGEEVKWRTTPYKRTTGRQPRPETTCLASGPDGLICSKSYTHTGKHYDRHFKRHWGAEPGDHSVSKSVFRAVATFGEPPENCGHRHRFRDTAYRCGVSRFGQARRLFDVWVRADGPTGQWEKAKALTA
jgi:hypothetical protein